MTAITTGTFVSWPGGEGRVDLLVKSGKVPGVAEDIDGTEASPAARVAVWSDGKPTGTKVAHPVGTLAAIEPLDADEREGIAALVTLGMKHAAHLDVAGLGPEHAVSGKALQTAYDRGLAAYPGSEKTILTREQWALGRAEHLTKCAVSVEPVETNDADLLDVKHPTRRAAEPETETLDRSEVEQQMKSLEAFLSDEAVETD